MCAYLFKALWQALTLLLCLPIFSRLSWILVQTPPGVPTLPVLWLYSSFKKTRLLVDFHNYSHSILAMAAGKESTLVKLTKTLERLSARNGAEDTFCVSRAMQEDLQMNWDIKSTVLYDRPPDRFRVISLEEKYDLFSRLSEKYENFKGHEFIGKDESGFCNKSSKPGLLVSSTSWTEDEDFSILLSALITYEERCESLSQLPDLVVVITGKGPQKDYYMEKIDNLKLRHVSFVAPWLEVEDYPLMLASADLGVCLHTSSSGLDLPMKVVDMFGCGLPVAAINFPAISELVEEGVNGKIFSDSQELSCIIEEWFSGFPADPPPQHQSFREELAKFGALRWDENWEKIALPKFRSQPKLCDEGLVSAVMSLLFVSCLFLVIFSLLPVVG